VARLRCFERIARGAGSKSGKTNSIADLAEQEGVTDAYVCRLLPLTCLAPDIVEAILDGRQPKGLRLAEMLGNGPLDWNEQRTGWGFVQGRSGLTAGNGLNRADDNVPHSGAVSARAGG
jgi:hypothetical protein